MMLLLFTVLSFALAEGTGTTSAEFVQWKHKFNRTYKTESAEVAAFTEWSKNRIIVQSNNEKGLWTAELGKFADLSMEEFQKKMLMKVTSPSTMARKVGGLKVKAAGSLPTAFDWRTDGATAAVTSVKDQGFVGSCWAFSTIGNIEGQWALSGKNLIDLSAEFLVDCDGSHDDTHADCSVFGGWPYLAYDFVIGAGGVPSEEADPYCAGTGDCYPCMNGPVSLCGPPPPNCNRTIIQQCAYMIPTTSISAWSAVSTDEDQIAATLVAQGPLSVLLDASQLQYYKSGVWNGHLDSVSPALGCKPTNLDHAVLLVGYGVDSTSGTDVPFWTVKNSWGADWGEDGYFRIQRGVGMCGINTAVTTSIV